MKAKDYKMVHEIIQIEKFSDFLLKLEPALFVEADPGLCNKLRDNLQSMWKKRDEALNIEDDN